MSDRPKTMRLIAHIEFGLDGIRCLSEHFEDVTRQVDCRPCAARSGDTACAVSLLAAAHASIAALAERVGRAADEFDEVIAEAHDL